MAFQVGLIGLGVMGKALAWNFASKGISTVVYNRTKEKTIQFIEQYGNNFLKGEKNLRSFVKSIKKPRKILLMITSGAPIDEQIDDLLPYLDAGDIIIDGGNSYYRDTERRFGKFQKKKIEYVGLGISGGEKGALEGPSLMFGGSKKSWNRLQPMLTRIAALDFSQNPCVAYCGTGGAGHFVKMVHNGIEYAFLEIIAEAYDLFRKVFDLSAGEIADIFEKWNKRKLSSYLFESAVTLLRMKDPWKNGNLIDHIEDIAEQKGTGAWTVMDALERSVPIPSIAVAVDVRNASVQKTLREKLSQATARVPSSMTLKKFQPLLENACYGALLTAFLQGFDLIRKAAHDESWLISLHKICKIWQGGCIIRADFLQWVASLKNFSLENQRLRSEFFSRFSDIRAVVNFSLQNNIPTPILSSSLQHFLLMSSKKLPANLIQGLRNFFGAHGVTRIP